VIEPVPSPAPAPGSASDRAALAGPAAIAGPVGPAADGGRPVVELEGVHVVYRDREVLHGIDLTLRAGERVALVGPNGAGKSTVLRVVAGTLAPRLGAVRLGGDPIASLERREVARRLAVVPQLTTLPFAASVEDVVALGRLPHETGLRGLREADRAAVAAAIDRVGVGGLLGRDARELSLGERQLVLIAMAVAQSAPVLLLDEPTVHLDLRHRVEAMELLCDLNRRDGTTILTVIHDLHLAARFFPRVVLIDRGAIVADGAPGDVLSAERMRAVFGIDPALAGLVG
jgi:ABC-type cobalamin/Fe3+-siderophores transport system ATPase subunit